MPETKLGTTEEVVVKGKTLDTVNEPDPKDVDPWHPPTSDSSEYDVKAREIAANKRKSTLPDERELRDKIMALKEEFRALIDSTQGVDVRPGEQTYIGHMREADIQLGTIVGVLDGALKKRAEANAQAKFDALVEAELEGDRKPKQKAHA